MITMYLSPRSLEAARAVDPYVSAAAVHAAVEHAGVGDQAFLGGGRVQGPEAGDGVGAATAAQERDAGAVGGGRHAAGGAQGEAACPGLAAGEGVRHADSLPRRWRSDRPDGIRRRVGSFLPTRR